MRRPLSLFAAIVLVLTATPAVADDDPTAPSPDADLGGIVDQRYGVVQTDPEDVAGAEPTVVTDQTSLPAAAPAAEVYPAPSDGVYDVVGGGFGHRIGMSQYGAHGAGLVGLDHAEILDFYYPGTDLQTRSYGTIRIGITVDDDGTTRVDHRDGLRVGGAPGSTTYPLPDREQWRVRATTASASGCVLEGNQGGTWTAWWPSGMTRSCPVSFVSPDEETVDLYLPDGSLRVYRGTITATYRGSTNLATVNHVGMQQYLRSVVSAEMPSSFHQQALRAQAVAARSYAARGVNGTGYYDTCDTTYCQVYRGRGVRDADGGITTLEYTNNVTAVDATSGQVLYFTFAGGATRLATTMYSSSTGGHTTPAGNGHDYLTGQPDPYDATPSNARHRWDAELPVTSLENRYGIHDVTRVQVLSRDGHGEWGGRVLSARVEGFTADGQYTYADASGIGLMLARYWPTWRTGLSTDYFTFVDGAAPEGDVVRVAGGDRYETAAQAARAWAPGVGVVYVASGADYADALTAASRAGVYDAPVLLTRPTGVPGPTAAELRRLKPTRIVVVGGAEAVAPEVLTALRAYATSGTVERVAGDNRYETAAAMAAYYPRGSETVYLASGQGYADALAAAAAAGAEHMPLLITRTSGLDAATIAQLQRLDPDELVVLGGPSVVPHAVATAAAGHAGTGSYTRVAGPDRYHTASALAARSPAPADTAYVASGEDFPDALVGAARAGRDGVPLLLTRPDGVPGPTATALQRLRPVDISVLGGSLVVEDVVVEQLHAYLR